MIIFVRSFVILNLEIRSSSFSLSSIFQNCEHTSKDNRSLKYFVLLQYAVCRSPDHFPPGFLCSPDHPEVVGAVRQAALARQPGHVPLGPRQGQGELEGGRNQFCHQKDIEIMLYPPS